MASWSRTQVLKATTTSPWMRDMRHLKPFPRYWLKRSSFKDPFMKSVRLQDRIKLWNIVPGDQIRLRGDHEKTIHEVLSINRLSNRVFLKAPTNEGDEQNAPERAPRGVNVSYARCQLFLGTFDFPPPPGKIEPVNRPVFAARVRASPPKWAKGFHRFDWQRFAVQTLPRLGDDILGRRGILIPWPKRQKPSSPPPTIYDTELNALKEITYQPPTLPADPLTPVPEPTSEQDVLRSLRAREPVVDSMLAETYLFKELSNPHSRAKKQARWQAHKAYEVALLKQYIRAEVSKLNGRSVRDAKAEAAFKWRQRLEDERREEKKRRWRNRGAEAKLEQKRARKEKKRVSLSEKLRHLVLEDAPNQVAPKEL